jgi:uncharacterized protein YlxP (DUF503 family)
LPVCCAQNWDELIAVLTIHLHLPACSSLKEKRGRIKPLIARLHREFNVSAAELGMQDAWQEALIGCAMVGNESAFLQLALGNVAKWVHGNWPDGMVVAEKFEMI